MRARPSRLDWLVAGGWECQRHLWWRQRHDGYVSIPDSPNLNPTNEITVEAWFKPAAFAGGSWSIVDKPFTSRTSPFYQYHLSVTGDQHTPPAQFDFGVTVGGHLIWATSTSNIWTAGNWYHLVGTYDGAAVRLYTNGSLAVSTPATGLITTYGQPLNICRNQDNQYTPGTVDEVSIYNRALGPNEIAAIYAASSGGKCKPPVPCTPAPSGLVSWWPGDGDASDLQGINNGTLMGGTSVGSGLVGSAFVLDGTNNFVEVPDSTSLKPTEVTVELWFRPDSPLTNVFQTVPFLRKLNEDDSASGVVRGYELFYEQGSLYFSLPGASNLRRSVTLATNLPAGAWYHLAGTYDSATGQRLYLNGQLVASGPFFGTIAYSPAPILIGRVTHVMFGPNPIYFKGAIDEASIYNRALSSNEIAAIYAAGSAGKCKPSVPCTPAPSGLVSWWPGDGNANDLQGANSGSLVNGVTFIPGVVGHAYSFNGTDQYVDMGNPASLQITGPLTVEAWFKTSSTMGNYKALVTKWWSATSDAAYSLYWSDTGGLNFSLNSSASEELYASSGQNWNDGLWHHVGGTWDGSAVRIYVDGTERGSATNASFGTIMNTTRPFRIGADSYSAQNDFTGVVDEVSVYNRALSSNEIAFIYAAGSAGKCKPTVSCTPPPSGLVSWWPGDGNANDIIGTNSGTLQNGAGFAPGRVGTAFSLDGVDDYGLGQQNLWVDSGSGSFPNV